jgi:hypothetical protein
MAAPRLPKDMADFNAIKSEVGDDFRAISPRERTETATSVSPPSTQDTRPYEKMSEREQARISFGKSRKLRKTRKSKKLMKMNKTIKRRAK